MIKSTEAYYSKIVCTEVRRPTKPYRSTVYSVIVMGDRRQGHWRRGGGGGSTWPFTWPL